MFNCTVNLKLSQVFNIAFENSSTLSKDYRDLKDIGEPDFTADYVYLSCSENDLNASVYFACRAIAKMYKVDLESEVYCSDDYRDTSWYSNILNGNSKEAVQFLEEKAKTEQYAYRYLKWLSEDCHNSQYNASFENNRTNIPVECLSLKDNIAQHLAMALFNDPLAVYRIADLVSEEAFDKYKICTQLSKKLLNNALRMTLAMSPSAMWDLQRAKWAGYTMKTCLKTDKWRLSEFTGIIDLKKSANKGYPPAMYEYMHLVCETSYNLSSLNSCNNNITYIDEAEFNTVREYLLKLKETDYLQDSFEDEKQYISDILDYIDRNNIDAQHYINNGYRTDAEIRADKEAELRDYVKKLNEKERWRNFFEYGYSVSDKTVKEAADFAGLYETSFETQMKIERRNEKIEKKIKKLTEE
ncbi:MAG: hypothetical protein ACI4WM_03450 [Erysipelotrichaceae bacterium]